MSDTNTTAQDSVTTAQDSVTTAQDSVTTAQDSVTSELDSISCPRCGSDISNHEFYGVCNDCASSLRDTFNGSPRGDVTATEYEPKMNVTPNAVASKE